MERSSFGNWLKSRGITLLRLLAFSLVSACVLLISHNSRVFAVYEPAGYHLAFEEDFSGSSINDTIMRTIWSDYTGAPKKSDAVSVSGGIMTITAYTTGTGESMEHWGGCVGTPDTYAFNYGYVEAVVKFNNDKTGCNMNQVLYADAMFSDPAGPVEDGLEIDIIEHFYTRSNEFPINLHKGGYPCGDENSFGPYEDVNYWYPEDPQQPEVAGMNYNWHTLGFLWTPTGYTFYCDGTPVWDFYPTQQELTEYGEFRTQGMEWLTFGVDAGLEWGGGPPVNGYGSLVNSTTQMFVSDCKVYQLRPMAWNQGTGGSGTWNSANTNWNYADGGAGTTFSDHDNVFFKGSSGTVTIANGFAPKVTSMEFDTSGYLITGSSLELEKGIIIVNPGLTATINSAIVGNHEGITLRGEGTLVLGGNNTYTGKTIVRKGSVLNIRHPNALGSTSDGTVVNAYSALQIQGGITTANEPLLLQGLGIYYDGALRSISGNNTYAGLVTLASDVRIRTDADSLTLSNAGTITGNGYDMMILGAGNMTINSVIGTGAGGLQKYSTGSLTLTRSNSYTGPTVVTQGSLIYGTNNVLASGSLAVGEDSLDNGTVNMGPYSDTVGAVTLVSGTITGTGTLTSTSGFTVQKGTVDVRLAGSVGLTKTGADTVTLTKNNTYTGTTTVNEGTLAYGCSNAIYNGVVDINGGTLNMGAYSDGINSLDLHSGTITGTGSLGCSNGADLWSGTLDVTLTGTIGLSKRDSGTATVTCANTYAYNSYVYGGVLQIEHANALGGTSYGTSVSNGATLQLKGGITTAAEPLVLNGTGVSDTGALRNYSDNNTYTGPISLGSNSRINSRSGQLTISCDSITGSGKNLTFGGNGNTAVNSHINTGSGTVTKDGYGTLYLLTSNNYSGATNINSGTVVAQSATSLGTNAAGTTISAGATLSLQNSNTYTESFNINGGGVGNYGALRNLSGNNTITGAVTFSYVGVRINSDSGTLTFNSGTDMSGTSNLYFGGSGDIVVHTDIDLGNYNRLYKDGSGTVRLTGSNSYTGITNVDGGTLILDGMYAQSPVINYGGCDIEQGKLVLENPYSVNYVISLIESSYDGGDWDSGKFLCSTADDDHGLGWINDGGDITVAYTVYGDVDLDGDVDDDDVDIVEGNLYTTGDWADGDVNYDGYVNYTDLGIVNANYGMTQSFTRLEIDPVPEPSTLVLLAVAGIAGAVAYVRRRRSQS